jgi:endonuclease-8
VPEGDTLARTAAGLRPHLVGREVLAARVGPRGREIGIGRLVGARIEAVESVGKHLLLRSSNGLEVRTHLGMLGSWHRYRPGERWRRSPSRASLVLEVPGAVAVCFDAAGVELYEARAARLHPVLSALGPDLLDPAFDAAEARRRLRDPGRAERSIAEALLDQRALAGIGNVYKNESLWIERVDPFAPVGTLDDGTLDGLVATARRLMLGNVGPGSGPERTTTGSRRPGEGRLWVYGRAGRPCRRCGTGLRAARHGRPPRMTWWCPRCQSPRRDELVEPPAMLAPPGSSRQPA